MIHQYKNNGYDIVLDVNSGSVHVVDDMCYDIIDYLNKLGVEDNMELLEQNETLEKMETDLGETYPVEEIAEAFEDIKELAKAGQLFTKDVYEEYIGEVKKRKTVVKALCIHIAHDCNLACKYCFAEEGEYHGRRALMSYEVGKKALDFLIANSGNRRNLEVDFFGGEPLMNWQVVKDLVAYGRAQEKIHNKNFRFTLTTNGVLLNDEVQEFVNKEMDNVVLSLDGRKEVNDKMRPFRNGKGSYDLIDQLGQMPLPPYITHQLEDKNRYQTVYAKHTGSAAAPTAGLHFTEELLDEIAKKNVKIARVTLHVGLGTFRPVKVDNILEHHMHSEFYQIDEEAARKINETKEQGHRVICVGTTSCRTVESAADENGRLQATSGWTDIFIYPGYQFKILDCLITNFHLPESTLIMLVSALAGRENVLAAYEEAVRERYRFFSFGDAMFIR